MNKDNMTGAAREVEPFLEVLEKPLAALPEVGPLDRDILKQPDENRRSPSMYALSKAVVSGLDYGGDLFGRIEAAAAANIDVPDCRHNATVVLMLLSERNLLSEVGAKALSKVKDKLPVYFDDQLQQLKDDFAAGQPG